MADAFRQNFLPMHTIVEIDIEKCMLESWKTLLVSILLGTIVFSVSVYCLGKIYDTTQDGNTYHKLAVGSMKNGWIPLREKFSLLRLICQISGFTSITAM